MNSNLNYSLFLLFLLFSFSLQAIENGTEKQTKGPIMLIIGTRPEAVKVIPVYYALKSANIPVLICSTGQHAELLDEMFTLFNVTPDFNLKIMKPGQDLFYVTEQVLAKTREVFEKIKPSLVVVQGDTTTAMSASLAAFYLRIPVAHIEAGLRTHNIYAPFPEEMNRLIISRIASLNFAPTKLAVSKLRQEGIQDETIFLTGNPVVDALYFIKNKIKNNEISPSEKILNLVKELKDKNRKIILLTAHRRENFGEGLTRIFTAIKTAINENPDLYFIYPMHPNPKIKKTFDEIFTVNQKQIIELQPLPYQDLIYLLDTVDGVATDSGGIQEEAISLNKTTLILRNETDRPEGLKTKLAVLVGDDQDKIIKGIHHIVDRPKNNDNSSISPYGDGSASLQIKDIIQKFYNNN